MLATLIAFATEAAEEEKSKTAFYLLGGLAAVWAIVLFAVGMRVGDVPGLRRQRSAGSSRSACSS